jgi:hypothetical protein
MPHPLAARIVANDDSIKIHGADGLALTPLTHQGAARARSPAGAAAADRVLPTGEAIVVAGADDTGVELSELAVTIDTTAAPQARVEHCAIGVELACPGKALALIAF